MDFKNQETSYIIELINTLFRYGGNISDNSFYQEAYHELKRRQPKIAKLYEFKMMFEGDENRKEE